MKYVLPLFCALIIFAPALLSQPTLHRCSTDEKMEQIFQQNPAYEQDILKHRKSSIFPESRNAPDVVTIPVHVIIVHPVGQEVGEEQNLSVEHILSQVIVMNEDFRRTNPDAGNTPPEFAAEDSMIEFCMATVDPEGNATDGITRYPTDDFNANEFAIKDATRWPRETYLNIWVAPDIGFLGYAYVPGVNNLPNEVLDGVVCVTHAFGGPGYATSNNYGLGRTVTHEVGHYLGVGHVWRNDGCGPDDGFEDTPKQDDENFGCPTHPSPSCDNTGDMFMNYMDYIDDDCMNAFTADQNAYMHLILSNSRASIANAAVTACTVVEPLQASVIQQTDVMCWGEETGSFEIEVSGGVEPYEYSLDGQNFSPDSFFEDLPTGDYNVIIQDAEGTFFEIDIFISEPDQLDIFIEETINPLCYNAEDGSILFEVSGGSGPYFVTINGESVDPEMPFEQLQANVYFIVVEDENGCVSEADVELIQPDELILEIDFLESIGCNGEQGQIQGIASGGTGELLYSVDGINFFFDPLFVDLAGGDYDLFVQDESQCMSAVPFSILEYTPIELTLETLVQVECFGDSTGMAIIQTEGGNGNLQYRLNEGPFTDNPDYSGLPAGPYIVTVEDDNNCSTQIAFEIIEPLLLELSLDSVTQPVCPEKELGSFVVTAQGGTGDLMFSLNGGTQTGNGSFQNVLNGFHNVVVQDQNGCEQNIDLEIIIPEPIKSEMTSLTHNSCFGESNGSFSIEISGGTGLFTFDYNGMMTETDQEMMLGNLAAGFHTYIITDENDCLNEFTVVITEPEDIQIETIEITSDNGSASGSVSYEITGGTPPFQYSLDGTDFVADASFENLHGGDYFLYVRDANQCLKQLPFNIPFATDVTEIEKVIDFQIYPNPTSDDLWIRLKEKSLSIESASVITTSGIPLSGIDLTLMDDQVWKINTDALFPGTYILRIETEKGPIFRKFVKL